MTEKKQVVDVQENGKGSGSNAPVAANKSNYKGFVAGVFSGIAKLSGEFWLPWCFLRVCDPRLCFGVCANLFESFSWPSVRHSSTPSPPTYRNLWIECNNRWLFVNRFDTVKVRLQTSKDAHFKGPLDCTLQTVRKEGVRGLYKGASPPLVGWMVMDSV